ncbi:MAG: hypothetical protein D3924_04865 [Candidatus Electrothrix sp. AR4]|nr:hypothetical protein [Candidatus Electrothrix sp. AR4]
MKATERICNRAMVMLAAFFLAAVPLAAQGGLVADQTTVGGPGATKLCIRDYGKTVAEAVEAGAKLVRAADAHLGEGKLYGNVQMRILPEKENGLFVVEVYSNSDKAICAMPTYTTAQVTR